MKLNPAPMFVVPEHWNLIPGMPDCYLFIENAKLEFRYIGPTNAELFIGRKKK